MAAFTAAAVIGAAATAYSANKQRGAARNAADAQLQAGRESNQVNWNMANANAQLNDPFRLGGGSAYNEYLKMLGLNGQDFRPAGEIFGQYGSNGMGTPGTGYSNNAANQWQSTTGAPNPNAGYTPQEVMQRLQAKPGYQFRMGEGQRAIEASAAARGGLNSGSTLRALTRYGQNFGTQEYDNELNRLSVLFGGAQRATENIGNSAQGFGQTAGQNAINAGQARADMYGRQADASSQAAQSYASIFGNMFGRRG